MKRHELDVVSLIFGLFFALAAAIWLFWRVDLLNWDQLSWVPALALIGIGLLGVTLSIARSRPGAEDRETVTVADDWTDVK